MNVKNCFLLNILRMDGQNLAKFCLQIIIDKIYVGIVKCHFSQICNKVIALDRPSVCLHIQTLISLLPVGQSQSYLILSIIGVGEKLH